MRTHKQRLASTRNHLILRLRSVFWMGQMLKSRYGLETHFVVESERCEAKIKELFDLAVKEMDDLSPNERERYVRRLEGRF